MDQSIHLKQSSINEEMINSIILYVSLVTIIVGTVGSLCNMIIFTSKEFRKNSCAFYFLCSTIFDLVYLLFSGITRILIDNFSNILPFRSVFFCKFRIYLVVTIPFSSTLFLMFASIDRCLSTSNSLKWRNFSRMKIAWRVSMLTFLFSLFSTCHILFFFELEKQDVNINAYKCIPHAGIYRRFLVTSLFLSSPFITYTIMFICTVITLIRIRKSGCRVGFLNKRRRHRNIDHQLIIIIFVQIILGMLLTFFRCGFLVCGLWTNNLKKNLYRISVESIVDRFSLIIYYMNFAKSFSVNTLTSPLFRHVFRKKIIYLFTQICQLRKEQRTTINRTKIKLQKQTETYL